MKWNKRNAREKVWSGCKQTMAEWERKRAPWHSTDDGYQGDEAAVERKERAYQPNRECIMLRNPYLHEEKHRPGNVQIVKIE